MDDDTRRLIEEAKKCLFAAAILADSYGKRETAQKFRDAKDGLSLTLEASEDSINALGGKAAVEVARRIEAEARLAEAVEVLREISLSRDFFQTLQAKGKARDFLTKLEGTPTDE